LNGEENDISRTLLVNGEEERKIKKDENNDCELRKKEGEVISERACV
jgi:hypothetical protein